MEAILAAASRLAAPVLGTPWWRERRPAARERRERGDLLGAMEATPRSFARCGPDRTLLASNQACRALHTEGLQALSPPCRRDDPMRAACPPRRCRRRYARRIARHTDAAALLGAAPPAAHALAH